MWKSIRKWTLAVAGLVVLSVSALPAGAENYGRKGGYRGTEKFTHRVVRSSPAKHYRFRNAPRTRATSYRYRNSYRRYDRRHVRSRPVRRRAIVTHRNHWRHNDRLVAAGIVGALVGAIVSRTIADSMDDNDHVHVVHTLEHGRTGNRVVWSNPTTGSRYAVTPTRTYQLSNGRYCREYTTWGWVGGYEEQLHGTVCRMPDGSWQKQG